MEKVIANILHTDATDGEHTDAYEPPCEECIRVAGIIAAALDSQSCASCIFWLGTRDDPRDEDAPDGWKICDHVVYPDEGVTAFVTGPTFLHSGFLWTAPEHCCSMWAARR